MPSHRTLAPVAVAALALVTSSPAVADEDLSVVAIDLGRIPLLLDQVDDRLCAARACGPAADAPHSVAALSVQLEATIWDYNALRTRLCAANKLSTLSCGHPYLPSWLAHPSKKAISAATLTARVEAFNAEVYPLWEAACAGADRGAGECVIE